LESGFSELRMKFFEKHTLTQNSRFATGSVASSTTAKTDGIANEAGLESRPL